MKTILCPTRGGESSYPNQDYAIALAKDNKAKLIFLFVSDVQFLNQMSSPVLVDMANEMKEMGEFLMAMAQERASEAGIEAESIVRSGDFGKVVNELIPNYEIDCLILGSSDQDTGHTTDEFLHNLSAKITDDHNIEVVLLRGGKLLHTISPPKE